jgi:tripartite-type tricarboxylate transporter receptor subunit TctC
MMHKLLPATVAGLLAAAMSPAMAETGFPNQPITLIVPFGPGGTSDIMARFLQQPLAEALGATVVIENRAGAGGAIGMSALARAKPDGHTIGLSVIGPEILQPSLKKTDYNHENFDHLCGTYDVPLMMMVKPDSPYRTLADVITDAKAKPGELQYGSSGTGTVLHLSMAMLLDEAGAQALHVPYKSSGEMVTGLLGDQIMLFNETPTMSTQYGLRGLAVFAKERLPAYPDTPTAAEGGFPMQASVWGGLIAPRGLPQDVKDKLEAACQKAAHSDYYQERANKANTPLVFRTGEQYADFVKTQQASYAQLIDNLDLADKH